MNSTIKLPIELTEEEIEHDLWVLGGSVLLHDKEGKSWEECGISV